jgi:hypothetical protein
MPIPGYASATDRTSEQRGKIKSFITGYDEMLSDVDGCGRAATPTPARAPVAHASDAGPCGWCTAVATLCGGSCCAL